MARSESKSALSQAAPGSKELNQLAAQPVDPAVMKPSENCRSPVVVAICVRFGVG